MDRIIYYPLENNGSKTNGTDFIINNHVIPWRKAIDRVAFYSPKEQLEEAEALIKKYLSAWATDNNVTFIDIETIIDYFKPIFTALNNLPACPDCSRYTGPSREEINKRFAFNEIEDEPLRWLLADYDDYFSLKDTHPEYNSEYASHYGKYVFYFSATLLNEAADFNRNINNRLSKLYIPACYWKLSRQHYGCPAFAVCTEESQCPKRWPGINIINFSYSGESSINL